MNIQHIVALPSLGLAQGTWGLRGRGISRGLRIDRGGGVDSGYGVEGLTTCNKVEEEGMRGNMWTLAYL